MTREPSAAFGREVPILVCRACGTKTPLDWIRTASPACQTCGNYGTCEMHDALVVEAVVRAREVYPWTPYLDPKRLRQELLSGVYAEMPRPATREALSDSGRIVPGGFQL